MSKQIDLSVNIKFISKLTDTNWIYLDLKLYLELFF